MTKKTRLIILIFCVVCFFVIAPILVAYSMGYRFDFEKDNIVATGGIYVRTFPAADKITIDSKISQKPGLFSNWIFTQSLLPKKHTILVEKAGYYDYSKTLPVEENQVAKIENVLLIKKSITFTDLVNNVDYFSIAPNNQNIITASSGAKSTNFSYFSSASPTQTETFSVAVSGTAPTIAWSGDSSNALIKIIGANNTFYYLFITAQVTPLIKPTAMRLSYLDKTAEEIAFDPQNPKIIFYIKNNILYSTNGTAPLAIIKNVVSYKISGSTITWMSTKGVLESSDLSGKLINNLSLTNFEVDPAKTYEISQISQNTFLKENSALYELNQNTKKFTAFAVPMSDYKVLPSPDGKNLLYCGTGKIYLYPHATEKFTPLYSGSQISNCEWLNNDYIIFSDADKIIISEIDYRGNINTITLAQPANSVYFNPQDGKLYVLAQKELLESEKITP